jgi:protein-S-isoprenylcysteine O-methyltransferase Ste14/chorismate mutase
LIPAIGDLAEPTSLRQLPRAVSLNQVAIRPTNEGRAIIPRGLGHVIILPSSSESGLCHMMHAMLDPLGHFLFRQRNLVFPIVLVMLQVLFRPLPIGDHVGDIMMIAGALLAFAGQSLRIATIGLDYIKRGGKGGRIYANRLVTGGIYRHTRNPMYAGNILIVLGLLLVGGNPIAIALGASFFIAAYYLITASEEQYLESAFGTSYAAYCARVPRWLPRLRNLFTTITSYRFDWPAVVVKEYGTIFSTVMIITVMVAYKAHEANLLQRYMWWFIGAGVLWGLAWGAARFAKKGLQLKPRGVTPVSTGIQQERKTIDAIDAAILDLMNERARHVSAIWDLKLEAGMPRFDPVRTRQILARLRSINTGPLTDDQVESFFGSLLQHYLQEYETADESTAVEIVTQSQAAGLHIEAPIAAPL